MFVIKSALKMTSAQRTAARASFSIGKFKKSTAVMIAPALSPNMVT